MRAARLIAVPLTAALSVALLAGCNDPAEPTETPAATMEDDATDKDAMEDESTEEDAMEDEG